MAKLCSSISNLALEDGKLALDDGSANKIPRASASSSDLPEPFIDLDAFLKPTSEKHSRIGG